ncbi:D-alanyl-D-alanine carboxypeptidase family protein [Candidatus Saccharibacteria bacterium]|nr:D-alanyl-D-alanine carboxypeptidase family protein [Candidatus Saccharibacteria bacterium]
MRVVEPNNYIQGQPPKKRKLFLFIIIFLLAVVLGFGIWKIFFNKESSVEQQKTTSDVIIDQTQQETQPEPPPVDNVKDTLILFEPNEFRDLFDNANLPNTTKIVTKPSITGNATADARIISIAENRGYKLRSTPTVSLTQTIEGFLVQNAVVEAYAKLKQEASDQGLTLSIVSGYRSVDYQRTLFMQRLSATGATVDQVASGQADDKVNKVLITSSIPGYSKHHTGYTLDLKCVGTEFEKFKNSACFTWISADNYKAAKEAGFIPSYPEGADSQGPDPEAWEYVYVGTDMLYE